MELLREESTHSIWFNLFCSFPGWFMLLGGGFNRFILKMTMRIDSSKTKVYFNLPSNLKMKSM